MPPTLHSSFSASSSQRLLNCPGSFHLGQLADDGTRKSSVYAAEGTLAHAIAEAAIHSDVDPYSFVGDTRAADGFTFTIDDDFAEAVTVFVDYVRGLMASGYIVALERVVTPQVHWDGLPELPIKLFGTADVVAFNPATRHLIIADLKFGRGVVVNAEGNTQLRYYGSGAAHPSVLIPICDSKNMDFHGVKNVDLVVIQPRAVHREGPIRKDTLHVVELIRWAETTLYDGVKTSLADKGKTLCAGDHCKFCPALTGCKEPEKLSRQIASAHFANAPIENIPMAEIMDPAQPNQLPQIHLSDDKLAELLDKATVIEPWIKALKQMAQDRMEAGQDLKGWKVVPKRATRRWAEQDQQVLINDLAGTGLPPEKFSTIKALTPAQVERKVGKGSYQTLVAPHVVSTSSGNTIASEGDPRVRLRARTTAEAFGAALPPTSNKDKP